MGTWNVKINGNDTFLDIYQNYFTLYNSGEAPNAVSRQIKEDYADYFNDHEDKYNSLFGLALAQWETKVLEPDIFQQVKEIIDNGKDIELWQQLGADDKTLKKRQAVLERFLAQLSRERPKPKRRLVQKQDFREEQLIGLPAPDGKKKFSMTEVYIDGQYTYTIAMIEWPMGGGSVFSFKAQGKTISAKWLDSQMVEVTHEKSVPFSPVTTKKMSAYYDDLVQVIYVPLPF